MTEEGRRYLSSTYELKGLPGGFKGQDSLQYDGYRVSSVNLLIRIAGYLKNGIKTETQVIAPVAPWVSVNLGSKFDSDSELVRLGERNFLPYTDSEDEFVTNAFKTYFAGNGEYLNWLIGPGTRTYIWDEYLRTLTLTYRLESELAPDDRSVTPQTILKAHEDFLRITQLSGFERHWFSTIGLGERFDLGALKDVVLAATLNYSTSRYSLDELWGLYDLPVKLMDRQVLGIEYDSEGAEMQPPLLARPTRFGFQDWGRGYYKARASENRGAPLASYNPDVDRYLDRSVTAFVRQEADSIRAFHDALDSFIPEVALRPEAERPRVDVNMDLTITGPWVSETLTRSFDANLRNFQQSTHRCFVEECTDFN
jgi:hypothetical protein